MQNAGKEIGARIKAWRLDRGLSQEALATRCGWDRQARISNYENGREPKLQDLRAIARALDLDVIQLLQQWPVSYQDIAPASPLSMAEPAPEYSDPVRQRYERASPKVKQAIDALLRLSDKAPAEADKVAKAVSTLVQPPG